MTSDGVTGRAVAGAGWVTENVYVGQLSVGFGAGATTNSDPAPGSYTVSGAIQPPGFPGGTYALFTLAFDRVPAFSFRTMQLPAGSGTVGGMELRTPAHYSVRYDQTFAEWGASPWIGGTDFYQTFVATSPYITRVATKLAGKGGDHQELTLNFAVYETNAYPPSAWRKISPTRSLVIGGGVDPIIWVFFVNYRSSEMQLVPGRKYAARFWRAPGSPSPDFSIVVRTDSQTGYAGGHLYAGDTPYPNLDAYAYISGGDPETLVNAAPVENTQLLNLTATSTRFGQTFRASGVGLAGAEIVYTTGITDPPSLPVTFRLYDSVGGTAIGPAKKCYGIPGFYQARAAAFWSRDEAPMVAGQTYYLEWTTSLPGVNTWLMNENIFGEAYVNRVSQAPSDLMMAIAEYTQPAATIGVDPTQFSRAVAVGSSPLPDTLTIQNLGSGTMSYTLATDVTWLSLDPLSGSSSGEANAITVTYSTASLAVGSYTGQIYVVAPGASNSPVTVPVYLTVLGPPNIVCPASLSASGQIGADAPPVPLTLQNSGFGSYAYTITSDSPWMEAQPAAGTCGGQPQTVNVVFHSASLTAGEWTGTLTVTSPDAVNSPQTVTVTLTIEVAPDFDRDGDVDLADFTLFQLCFNGPNEPPGAICSVDADFDNDGDADLHDFGVFTACFNGPNRPSACSGT